jgi:ATP/maltotriose-dependent transcriptional regulator MalT
VNEARQMRDRALGLAESHGDLELLGWIHTNWVNLAVATGEPEDALDHARKGVDIAERLGSSFSRLAAYLTTATAHQVRGEWAEARAWAERSLDLLESARTGVPYEAFLKSILAECALGMGDVAEARRLAEDAVATAVRRHTRGMEARARVVLGRSLTVSGVTEGARRELEEALGMSRACGLAVLETTVHEALAELAAAEGDRAGCEAELREALRMHRKHGATGHERRLLNELEPRAPSSSTAS